MNNQIIDRAALPTPRERSRQKFISTLRRKILVDLAGDMRHVYENVLVPYSERKTGKAPKSAAEIRKTIADVPVYKFYSSARYKAQEMVWESVRPQIERNRDQLVSIGKAATKTALGSLRLNPDLEIPRYVSELDVHLMPGCFHSEFGEDDVSMGAIYNYGVGVFYGGLPLTTKGGGPGATIAHSLAHSFPDFKPEVIVDLGCTTGSNTFPYVDVFPDAEVHGIDVGAPMLRYAHARAAAMGIKVHFSQQDATKLDFADNSVDFITSTYFLHEIPVKVTREIFKECYRVLKPGGIMLHFELPPQSEVDAYHDFYLDWDAYYNNEPSYAQFRGQSLIDLCTDAGFPRENYHQRQLLNWGTVSDEEFAACASGAQKAPIILNGGSWFTFGARK